VTPPLTAAFLRERLSRPDPKPDAVTSAGRAAAVLIPIVMEAEPRILLTRRADTLRNHGGQVSFPGGRIDAEDASAEAAALREAWEEIGLDPGAVDIIGRLPIHETGTGFHVTPVVGLVASVCGRRRRRSPHFSACRSPCCSTPRSPAAAGFACAARSGATSGSGRMPIITSGVRRRRCW
jgi:ADP-ribose pyrophosphatase YjhB (NUDIX family)